MNQFSCKIHLFRWNIMREKEIKAERNDVGFFGGRANQGLNQKNVTTRLNVNSFKLKHIINMLFFFSCREIICNVLSIIEKPPKCSKQ